MSSYPEWTRFREAEEAYEAERGLPNLARITIRHDGEAIGFVDVFPGEGNYGVVADDELKTEFRTACLAAAKALVDIANEDD